jgi:hypothetical protein
MTMTRIPADRKNLLPSKLRYRRRIRSAGIPGLETYGDRSRESRRNWCTVRQ